MTITDADQELLYALAVNNRVNGSRREREGIVIAFREAAEARAREEGAKAMHLKATCIAHDAVSKCLQRSNGRGLIDARATLAAIAALDLAQIAGEN